MALLEKNWFSIKGKLKKQIKENPENKIEFFFLGGDEIKLIWRMNFDDVPNKVEGL